MKMAQYKISNTKETKNGERGTEKTYRKIH